jgi:radical SAM superfamily enzyme YgiQ (UPF0313 family)
VTVRLLLVNPRFNESFWSFRWALREILSGKRTVNPPLGLATLAALCPPDWEVRIVDENVEPVPLKPDADIVGVCGMGAQHRRQAELLHHFRGQGYYTVAGGSYASLCPERYATLADTVVSGEAEYIWKAFCRDYTAGQPRPLYRETGTVALADSPVPRFDLLKLRHYTTATLQFSRGCPFRCEFCDIIVMFGRRPRWKTLPQVERELDALRALHVRNVFFVDDNLIGHKAVAKELLRFLRDYQMRHGYRFNFGTEASLNLAQDTELLQLMREANFEWVFIGIESPDEATLKETRKTQNTHEDVLTSIQRIFAHGIDVLGGFIVGFDNDTPATFERQQRFISSSGIQVAMIGLLTALPKTPLHERLRKEGRLLGEADASDNTQLATNVVPKRMGYEEMIASYQRLYRRLLSDRGIAQRVRNKARHMRAPVYRGNYTLGERVSILARLLVKGLLPGGVPRVVQFLRSLPWTAPTKIPLAVMDWIAALSMRDFVERHFRGAFTTDSAAATRWFVALQRVVGRHLTRAGAAVELKLEQGLAPQLQIRLKGALGRAFYARCARRLPRLMRETQARVTLIVEEAQQQQLLYLERMLARLARYGDRIYISVAEPLRARLAIDLSMFHLVLEPIPANTLRTP